MATSEQLPPILFFGNDWAAENRTSSHHIARWLAKRYKVYYIECPGLRAPKQSGRDLKKIWNKVARFLRGPRLDQEGPKVWTLLQLPLHRFRIVRWLNRVLLLGSLRWLMLHEGIRSPLAWFMLPHLSSIVGRLGESLSLYYCIDDYSALPDVNEQAVKAMDEEMTAKADVVFVAAATLLEQKRKLNPNTHLSPHGVDLDHFQRAQLPNEEPPPEVKSLPRPIVGFFGLIEQWIDLDLVNFLAEQRPTWSFVLIGRVAVPDNQIPRRPNIHFLGTRSYQDLPRYGSEFDVAIIPYRLTRQVMHANPIKLREYLAMGKPVVAVATPEIEKYADVVRIGYTQAEFLHHLDETVSKNPSSSEVAQRVSRVRSESWEARLTDVLEVVKSQLSHIRPETNAVEPSTATL